MHPSVKGAPPGPRETGETIRVVSARTGLPMDTLRAWERRYGFPSPERRAGSNRRLYSAADIERLQAITRALERGYRVGDVIDKSLPDLAQLAAEGGPSPLPASVGDVERWLWLLERDRVVELETQLRQSALALGPRRFVTELAHPFAVQVGEAWANGRLSVRHEHLATECLTTQLRQMLANQAESATRPLVLLATLPDEPHTLPLQLVAVYLLAQGARPRLLGGSTPVAEIAQSARALGADAVGLTITMLADRKRTRDALRALRKQLGPDFPVWLGGAGAQSVGLDLPGMHLLLSWQAIDAEVEQLRADAAR